MAKRSNNPSGVIKSVPAYIKKRTKGGQQIVDEMLKIAFGRGKEGTPIYSIKERWQALKWLGDHMDESGGVGDLPEQGKIYLVDYSKVKNG